MTPSRDASMSAVIAASFCFEGVVAFFLGLGFGLESGVGMLTSGKTTGFVLVFVSPPSVMTRMSPIPPVSPVPVALALVSFAAPGLMSGFAPDPWLDWLVGPAILFPMMVFHSLRLCPTLGLIVYVA